MMNKKKELELEFTKINKIENVDEKIKCYNKLIKNCKLLQIVSLKHKAMVELSICYYQKGDNKKSKSILHNIFDVYKMYPFIVSYCTMLSLLGVIELSEDDYPQAKFFFEECYDYAKRHKDQHYSLVSCQNIALVYADRDDLEKSLKWNLKALDYSANCNDSEYSTLYLNLAVAYKLVKDYKKSDEYFNLHLKYNQPSILTYVCGLDLYDLMKNESKASEYEKKVFDIVSNQFDIDYISAYKVLVFRYLNSNQKEKFKKVIDLLREYESKYPSNSLKLFILKRELKFNKLYENGSKELVILREMADIYEALLDSNSNSSKNSYMVQLENSKLKLEKEKDKKIKSMLKELSFKDSLTQLPNRHAFNSMVKEISKNGNECYGISMIDIDKFKQINDNFGHLEGDRILSSVGSILKNQFTNDIQFYRYGGDEFIGIFKNIDKEYALKVLSNIKSAINKLILKNDQEEKNVTCTMGFYLNLNDSSLNVVNLIEKADELLYIGKQERNCIKTN